MATLIIIIEMGACGGCFVCGLVGFLGAVRKG
jgi:hypothetical protein